MDSVYLKKLLKILSGTALAQLFPFLAYPVFTRLVELKDLGVYSVWLSVVYILSVMAGLKMDVAIVSVDKPARRRIAFLLGFGSALLMGVVASCVAVALDATVRGYLPNWSLTHAVLLGVAVFSTAMQPMWISLAIAVNNLRAVNLVRIAFAGGTAILQVLLVSCAAGRFSLVWGYALGTLGASVLGWWCLRERDKAPVRAAEIRQFLKEDGKDFLWAVPSALINNLSQQMPTVLIGARFGEGAAALFGTAWRMISAPMSILSSSAQDVFKKAASDEFARSRQCAASYLQTLKLLSGIAVVPSAILYFFGADLVALVFGENVRGAGHIVEILAPMLFIRFFASPLGYTLFITRQARVDVAWQLGLLLMTTLSFFVPDQALASYYCFSAGYALMYVLYLLLQWRAAKGIGRPGR